MKSSIKVLLVLLCFCFVFLTQQAHANEIEITNGNTSNYVISLAEDAIPAEKTAAAQLQKYLQLTTGVSLKIEREDALTNATPQILIGAGKRVKNLLPHEDWNALGTEGIVIKTVDNNLILAGGRPRGTLYAVFQFLEDQVGVRWWTPTEKHVPHLSSPFELCSPIEVLQDGRWIWPTSTWRDWDGGCPNGMKMVAWVSHDKGKPWPEYLDVMSDPAEEKIYWESKFIELQCGALLAVAWVYDEKSNCDLPNHFSISHDGGESWTQPTNTSLHGQTMAITELPDGIF